MHFGIHTGQQHCTYDEMRQAWKLADAGGFEWVSLWDHLYPALVEDPGGSEMEAVALMASWRWDRRNEHGRVWHR